MQKPPVCARDLKFRVRIDAQPVVAGPGGLSPGDWTALCTRRAAIRPVKTGGNETVIGERLVGRQPVMIFLRVDAVTKTITSDMRVVELSGDTEVRKYAIKTAFDMEGDNRFITLLATAGDNDA